MFWLGLCFVVFAIKWIETLSRECSRSDVHKVISVVSCNVENLKWYLKPEPLEEVGCLIGKGRCVTPKHIPQPSEVVPSNPPPISLNPEYYRLASIAESLVPKTWWRDSFDNDMFLLSHNDAELPLKMLDMNKLRVKKLRNLVQCTTRQQFIRKSLHFFDVSSEGSESQQKCNAMNENVVKEFYLQWEANEEKRYSSIPDHFYTNEKLFVAALEVLDYFYSNYGGIWTGCFKIDTNSNCRGALAGM